MKSHRSVRKVRVAARVARGVRRVKAVKVVKVVRVARRPVNDLTVRNLSRNKRARMILSAPYFL